MDRREMIRRYKESRHPMGVYRVWNRKADKSLVGSSINLPAMLNRQKAQLQFGGHPNHALQNDWNELGPEAFAFEILDTLTPPDTPGYDPSEDLRTLEALWLERLSPYGEKGYNRKP